MGENIEKYEAVLADLENERQELDKLILAFRARIAAKREASRQVDLFPSANGQKHVTVLGAPGTGRSMTIYEGSEAILRAAGKPLHAKVLVQRLAGMGKTTSVNSVAGSLPQDTQKRFRKVGPSTFGLMEWPEKQNGT